MIIFTDIDDVYIDIQDEEHLATLKSKLESASVLKFTYELAIGGSIPFLDVQVDSSNGKYITSVYRKPTDEGFCLNGDSEAPEKYKSSVIRAYIHRAIKHCTSWALLHQEFSRIKQMLTNNNYKTSDIDDHIRRALHSHFKPPKKSEGKTQLKLYYKSNMNTAYKTEEKVIRDIVTQNCTPTNEEESLHLIVYYKSPKISSLVMKNNLQKTPKLKATNVVYEFKCPIGDCARQRNSAYIGHTTTTLSRRMTMHLQDGAPLKHLSQHHNMRLTRKIIEENTSIITKCSDVRRLRVLEAVHIRDRDPLINRQQNMRGTLYLYDGRPLAPRV